MGWLKDWVLKTFFANLNDPQMWQKLIMFFVGPQVAAIILNVVQAVEAGKIPVVAAARLGAPEPTGPEKQAAAQSEILKQLEALGIQLGMVLLRLAIEVAVAYVRSQTGSLV